MTPEGPQLSPLDLLLVVLAEKEEPTAVIFSRNGKRIAWANKKDGTIHILDVDSGKEIRKLQGHKKQIEGLSFSPDGLRLVSASQDGTAIVWSLK